MRKGILIDVFNESITEVQVEKGIQPIYDLLKCHTFEVVGLDDNNDIYVDEEGLLSLTPESKFFTIEGGHQPLAGNGLVLGFNPETGATLDCSYDIEVLKSKVKFHTLNQVRQMV